MTQDKLIGAYITSVKQQMAKLKDDLSQARFTDLYQVGDLQGRITGHQMSLDLLDKILSDQED